MDLAGRFSWGVRLYVGTGRVSEGSSDDKAVTC